MCCECYRQDTQCLNTFGIVMGVITAIIVILNIVLIIDFAAIFGGIYALYYFVHTIIFGGIGFCNFWFARKKAEEGDTAGLNTCVLVLFVILLPAAMAWSYFWIIVSILVNAVTGDADNAVLGYIVFWANLIFGVALIVTSWFCVHSHQPPAGQQVTQVQVVQTVTAPGQTTTGV